MKLSKTLSTGFSGVVIAIVVVTSALLVFFMFISEKKSILAITDDMASIAANSMQNRIDDFLDIAEDIGRSDAFLSGIRHGINQNASLEEAVNANKYIDFIFVTDKNHKIIASSDEEYAENIRNHSPDFKENTLRNGFSIFIADKLSLLGVGAPYSGREACGEVVVCFSEKLKLLLGDITYSMHSGVTDAFLILPNYSFVSPNESVLPIDINNIDDRQSVTESVSKTVIAPSKNTIYTSNSGKRYMSYASVPNLSSAIAVSVDDGFILAHSIQMIFPALILMFVIMTMFLYYRHIISKRILYPLSLLSRSLDLMRKGDLRARFNYHGNDEFGNLSRTFNQRMTRMQDITNSLRDREMKYGVILDTVTDIIWEYNISAKTFSLSDNWHKTASFSHTEIKNEYSLDEFMFFIHHDYAEDFGRAITNCIDTGDKVELELQLKISEAEYMWTKLCGSCVCDEFNEPYKIIGSLSDIGAVKEREAMLREAAIRDNMTKLYNKTEFERLVTVALSRAIGSRYIIMVDLDGFKIINDSYGHLIGDKIVLFTASILKRVCERSCIISRFGGDEFTIYVNENLPIEQAEKIAQDILSEINKGYRTADGALIEVHASLGISHYPDDDATYKGMMKKADAALYISKIEKNRYTFYKED